MNSGINRYAVPAFFIFIFIKSFAGPVGMISPLINYVGVAIMLLLLSLRWLKGLLHNSQVLLFSFLFLIYTAIGIMNFGLYQVMFGIYILIPFLFCFSFSDVLAEKLLFNSNKIYLFLGGSCAIGIIYVDSFGAAWLGNMLNVGGHEKVLSRDWTASGVLRNPGFTGASFDAATLLMICSFFILYSLKNRKKFIKYIFLAGLTLYPIYLTTTKTTIFTFTVVALIMLLPRYMTNAFCKVVILFSIIFTYYFMIPSSFFENYDLSNTLFIRMYSTWPDAISLLTDPVSMILGKGFGSIGTPALIFSPKDYNPADNVLVYLYVIGGIVSVALTIIFTYKFSLAHFFDDDLKRKYYLFAFVILTGGITYNLFESVFYGPFAGVLIGILMNKKYVSMKKIIS